MENATRMFHVIRRWKLNPSKCEAEEILYIFVRKIGSKQWGFLSESGQCWWSKIFQSFDAQKAKILPASKGWFISITVQTSHAYIMRETPQAHRDWFCPRRIHGKIIFLLNNWNAFFRWFSIRSHRSSWTKASAFHLPTCIKRWKSLQ